MSASAAEPTTETPGSDLDKGTAQVMSILLQLISHGGWLSTSALAAGCPGLGRDTARRILYTLESRQWVRREPSDGRDLWTIGAELPRIGIQFQELLNARAALLRSDFDALTAPFSPRTR